MDYFLYNCDLGKLLIVIHKCCDTQRVNVAFIFSHFADLFGPSSPQEDGLFEGTGSPFGKKKGLFSGGGNLFDDVEEKVALHIR